MVSAAVVAMLATTVIMLHQVSAQVRPSYHPRPGGFSHVLPQYTNNQPGGGDADVGNRDNAPQSTTTPSVNSLDDTQLVNRVQEWPRPNQPFWYLNQQHIAQHTAQKVPCEGPNCQPIRPVQQSSFLGRR